MEEKVPLIRPKPGYQDYILDIYIYICIYYILDIILYIFFPKQFCTSLRTLRTLAGERSEPRERSKRPAPSGRGLF